MATPLMIRRGLLASLVSAVALVPTMGCGRTPTGPTTESIGAAVSGAQPIDLATCLGGNGGGACFNSMTRGALLSVAAAADVNAPTNLTASVSGNTVSLSWAPPTTGDAVTGYVLEAGSAPGLSNLANIFNGAATSLIVPGVPFGVYYVRVRATGPSGTSAPSNEVVITVGGCAGPPQNLVVASQSAATITLAWQPPASGGPTSYVIVAGSAPGLSNLATFDTGNANPGVVVNAVPAGSYYVRVQSRSSCGLSAASNEVLVFAVSVGGDVQVSVSWDAPSDVDLHVVEPSGEDIFYGHPSSATGGQLDVDSNAACGIDGRQIENVRWSGQAPNGTYIVRVDYWASCGVERTNYLVTVRNGSSIQTFQGSFTGPGDNGGEGSGVTIATFVHASPDAPSDQRALFRAPDLFTPSPLKLKPRGGR